jgi:glycosyltransferase involved in cell wall biosynthesis
MEKVSIIIPVHNAANYIAATLKSVQNQTYQHLEVIVVNGGSTDTSIAIVEELKLPNLTIYHRENLGQASNSNYGIAKATGKLIKFLDADDILAEDCIEKMVEKWRENPNRLVFGEWHYFVSSINNVSWNYSPVYKDYESALDWYVDVHQYAGSMLAGWMWLIPVHILKKAGGWDEQLTITNDLEFSTRLILQSDGIGFASGAVHYYRKGVSSAMTSVMTINLPKSTSTSVINGLHKAFDNVISVENSARTRLVFSNLFQKWVYLFYPKHIAYVEQLEDTISKLGGSTLKPAGGKFFNILLKFLPWKVVVRIQIILYKTIWKPVLILKQQRKLKKQFGV